MIRVYLEDHGQDFLYFEIVADRIIKTMPFQGAIWDGRTLDWQSTEKVLKVGDCIRFKDDGLTLKYPIIKIDPATAPVDKNLT